MKKATKAALISACVLIAVGVVLCVLSFAAAHGDWNAYEVDSDAYLSKTERYDSKQVSALIFTDSSCDVELIRTIGSDLIIYYNEGEKSGYDFSLADDGTLTVSFHSERKWYEWFSLSFGGPTHKTVIAVPDGYVGDIEIRLESANLMVGSLSTNGALAIATASGDITLTQAELAGALSVLTTSGDIRVSSCTAGDVSVHSTSGDAFVDSLTCLYLDVSTISGDMDMQNIRCADSLKLTSTSGDIEAHALTAANDLQGQSTSGNIDLRELHVQNLALVSASGNIHAEIYAKKEDYRISTSTTSGNVHVPEAYGSEKSIEAKTTSGNIRIIFLSEKA